MRPTAILVLATLTACAQSGSRDGGAVKLPTPNETTAPAATAPAATAPAATAETMRGTVSERLDASAYSYLRLVTAAGETWVAVPTTTVAVGTEVTVENAMPMHGFESKTLGRTFERLFFGTLAGAAGVASATAAGQLPAGHPAVGQVAPGQAAPSQPVVGASAGGVPPADKGTALADFIKSAPAAPVHVDRAAGPEGRTIAEVWAQMATLKETTVVVRGQVVKYNGGILGRNWLHLRDGSGTEAAGDHDITVTTDDVVAIGDVVVARGTVAIDRDFGAGYVYPVIIETAAVHKGEI